jgi:hypothetical protein
MINRILIHFLSFSESVDLKSQLWHFERFLNTLPDIFRATPQSLQRLIPIAFDIQCVASVAALRETKISSNVVFESSK